MRSQSASVESGSCEAFVKATFDESLTTSTSDKSSAIFSQLTVYSFLKTSVVLWIPVMKAILFNFPGPVSYGGKLDLEFDFGRPSV